MAIRHSFFPVHIAASRLAEAQAVTRSPRLDALAQRFDQAMQLVEQGHCAQAFSALSGLASDGHPAAARIALMLTHRGTALFGGSFSTTRQERSRWQRIGE